MGHQTKEIKSSSNTSLFEWSSLKSFKYWQKIYIYFWLFSILGHYLETVWIIPLGTQWRPIMETLTPVAIPYGLGAVVSIFFVWPIVKRRAANIAVVFILSTLLSSIVEYLCALSVVIMRGNNQFWDYTNNPFNLNGFISADSSLVFGVLATAFIYFVYPPFEKVFSKISYKWINAIFWVTFISYAADLIYTYSKFL